MNLACLLNHKFILIWKNTLIPNFVKKGKIQKKNPVRIIRNSSYGYYQIKVYKGKTKIKSGEEYMCDS